MRHGSLFSGIGGFDLASEWMGWENVFHCEWNPFGQKVLNHYWPKAISYHDITKTDFTIHRGTIDILTGGFPCQPYSMAGKRKGKEDERHLWPEMLRAIREIQPTWVVGENVLGLVNWDGGLVFHEVQADLEAQGYEVQPYVLPAASVNAPHRRDRVWFVAYSNSSTKRPPRESGGIKKDRSKDNLQQGEWREETQLDNRLHEFLRYASDSRKLRLEQWKNTTEMGGGQGEICKERHKPTLQFETNGKIGNVADSKKQRLEGMRRQKRGYSKLCRGFYGIQDWENFPTVSPICTRDDGISDRLDSITFPKWRNESIKAGGNAIVPQVVHQIFKAIEQYNNLNK